MASENTNPFVLPGLGQSGEQARNPILAGMEMMRQAWQGLVNAGGPEQTAMMAPMTVEELDRRITDLRTVENWLRLNLSVLTSSIQGLEVQRATVATLRSFVETTMGAGHSDAVAASLDAALGVHEPRAARKGVPAQDAPAKPAPADDDEAASAGKPSTESTAMPTSAQAWWNMLQSQFDTLAAATMRGAEAVQAAAQAGAMPASEAKAKGSAVKSPSASGGRVPPRAPKTRGSPAGKRRAPAEPGKASVPAARRGAGRGGNSGDQ